MRRYSLNRVCVCGGGRNIEHKDKKVSLVTILVSGKKTKKLQTLITSVHNKIVYFMLSGRISRNIGENIFRSYTGTTSENTDFHVLVD